MTSLVATFTSVFLRFRVVLCLGLLMALAGRLMAEQTSRPAPVLGAASNFGQGVQPGVLQTALALGVADFRDAVYWGQIETEAGQFDFEGPRATYPGDILDAGASLSLTLNWGNPLYDNGDTPQTPDAVNAFGAFAGQLAERLPLLDALEIGNEFNGVNFVRGPLKDASPIERAQAHAAILAASWDAAKAVRQDIRILGGSSHSIPASYLWAVLDAGGAAHMDALALHPYTTPPEQLVRQIAVLRRHPDAADLPIEITEFGSEDAATAASFMMRDYCQMALAGVTRAVWYPLSTRDDGYVPLFEDGGRITSAGRAFRTIQDLFVGTEVIDVAPDPFTYGCEFGDDVILLWGAPRAVEVSPGIVVLDSLGAPVTGALALAPDAPLIFQNAPGAAEQMALGNQVRLGPQTLIADSFDQFGYPAADGTSSVNDPFQRLIRVDGREQPLATMPGQEAQGTVWVPYLGDPYQRPLRLTADQLLPGGSAANPVEIIHRYVAPDDIEVSLLATFAVAARSENGISVTATLNGEALTQEQGKAPITLAIPALSLRQGDVLDITVGPNGTAQGDVTAYRITLRTP